MFDSILTDDWLNPPCCVRPVKTLMSFSVGEIKRGGRSNENKWMNEEQEREVKGTAVQRRVWFCCCCCLLTKVLILYINGGGVCCDIVIVVCCMTAMFGFFAG